MSRYHVKTMKSFLAVALAVALFAPACGDPPAPTLPSPVAPTITETFTGTLLPIGNNMHSFFVTRIGGLQVSLTGIAPGATVGLGVGTPSGANCLLIENLTAVASPAAQLVGTATLPGSFCVAVYDVGNLVEAVNYTVVVLHS
jgi:hypothetical protein